MKTSSRITALFFAALVACQADQGSGEESAAEAVSNTQSPEAVVRSYYAASRAPNVADALADITADDVVLEAPSVLILNPFAGTDKVTGKAAFVKAISGGAFLLKSAVIAPPRTLNDPHAGVALSVMTPAGVSPTLVVSRIQLPLPNGDLLTQVEFFEVDGGKIRHLQSYYDGTRFIKALPSIAVERLKEAFSSP